MQTDWKIAYKLTSERTGKSEKLYKDIGDYVFKELWSCLRRPKSLITKLKGIGFWFLRKKRMEATIKIYPIDYDKTREDFKHDLDFLKYENKREIYELFKKRLIDYEEYITLKKEIKALRHGTKILLEPDKREDISSEPSQADS